MFKTKTRIYMYFNSEGELPSKVTQKITMLGFQPMKGESDYVYYWPKRPSVEEMIKLADKITSVLKGTKTIYSVETE